ncbi:hypothetical protein BHF71_07160 [Vulcanibacillus modesticaldus]|uniref:ABC3 transporter permease C-terminal domain-containing protein n=1 Tax=Vulcanibacillus modesticaldus TaxID=337097 RepID=A0A1D2YWD7_9BACI|nr:FtsX-like permease family protein [Vulcanibacillus modesticaldus]OEF99967.1 hypothetical protein BHF71_07160 [Vulcanibacillus modesticaldus]
MVLHKKITRTLLEHKAQYIGSILLIIISSLLFTALNISGVNIQDNLAVFRVNNVVEDASFITQNKIDNVAELEEKFQLILEERKQYDYKFDEQATLRILSETKKVDKYAVVKGHLLQKSREILIDQAFAKAHDLDINDELMLENNLFTIVGFMSTPDYIYPLKSVSDMLKNPETFGVAVIAKNDFSKFQNGLTFYSVKFLDSNKSQFKNYLTRNNIIINWLDKEDNNRITFVDGDVNSAIQMGRILPVAILILTILLVSIILWRLLKTEYTEIGTLYTLGYRKKEILNHYLSYPLIISLVGGIIGTIIGLLLVKPMIELFAAFYNLPVITTKFELTYVVLSLFLPLAFLIPSTIFIINRILKKPPLELMRGGGNKVKINFIERRLHLNRFRFSTKFKIREIVRNIPRTILMVAGIAFATMLLLVGFATKDSMDYLIEKNYKDIYQYNYDYIFNTMQFSDDIGGEKLNLAPYTSQEFKNGEKTFVIYGIEKDASLITFTDQNGNKLSLDQTIITKSLADKMKLKVGDRISVENKLNEKKFSITINKIADSYLADVIYMPLDEFNKLNDLPKGSFVEVISKEWLNIDESILLSYTSKEDIINSYNILIKPLRYMIGVIGFTAFIIGLIVIYVVTSLVIEENKKNISLLKILGYQQRELYSLILNSNTILVIIGFLISIPLLFVSLEQYFNAITAEMNFSFPVKLDEINMVIGFVVIILTYQISKFLNKGKINKISMVDTLKSKAE